MASGKHKKFLVHGPFDYSYTAYYHPIHGPNLRAAHWEARRLGMSEEDCYDCAAAFVLHVLTHRLSLDGKPALRHRCAHNYAINYRRDHVLRRAIALSALTNPVQVQEEPDPADTRLTAEQLLLMQEIWPMLDAFLSKLRTEPHEVILRHYQHGESVAEIAATLGRSPHAVEQMLYRTTGRLRELLERAGVCSADLFDFLPREFPLCETGRNISQKNNEKNSE